MKESRHVYDLLKKNLPEVDWQRIENVAGTGTPDINGCVDSVEFWIEAKIAKSGSFEIRPAQVAWCTRRANKGGRVFVVVREDDVISVYKPDGRGGFTIIFKTAKPFKYQELKLIFLYHKV